MTTLFETRTLGASGLSVPPIGIGTNKWGSSGRQGERILETYQAGLDTGLNLIDTAEVYTGGKSEKEIGTVSQKDSRPATICTKFMPLPTRLSVKSVRKALDASLQRLNSSSVDLYYIHMPYTLLRIESLMDALAEAHQAGKIRAIGVSNFNVDQMRRAAFRLAAHGIALAANEVHYSLIHRHPETNGVLDACRELNVALVAYFPLGSGMLTRPIDAKNLGFIQKRMLGKASPEQLQNLQSTVSEIASQRGVSISQVALNWLLQRDPHVIAIPGATSATHVQENAAALSWQLTPQEFDAIDQASKPWRP